MDILKPDLMWIQGRCYRINPQDSSFKDEHFEEDEFADESPECPIEEDYDNFEIETTENGRYRTSVRIPRFYFAYIIGTKGRVRHRLEEETKTQIRVPRQGQDGYIVITGNTKSGVSAARRRVNLIVMSARQKQQFTHFLSLPMTGDSIKKKFIEFKEKVLDICNNSRGVDESIFQSPEKLHLTLGTLVIMDKDEREKAARGLVECKENIIEPVLQNMPLRVRMAGIEYMNDDPAEVDVLYGKVHIKDGSQILQDLADRLVDYFISTGLMQKQYEQVKLHITLMNTLFRNEESGIPEQETSRRKQKPRESFDAVSILKNFEDYDFGEQIIDSVHVSLRYSKSASGYYQATADINLT